MKKYVDKDKLQEYTTKLTEKFKTVFAMREAGIRNRLNIEFLGRTIHSAPYSSGQGFLAREENGTLYIYTCYYNYDAQDEKSIIEKMDISGNVIATSQPLAMNHSNDMCTDGEYLYVCGYNSYELYKINPATLTIVQTIQLQYAIQAITYDYNKQHFYGFASNRQGPLEPYRIFDWDNTFSFPEVVGTYEPHYGVETMEYHSGVVFFNENAPNSVTAVDVKTWETIAVSMFNEFMSDYYPIGEMQGISIYNDNGDFITAGKPRQRSLISNSYEIGFGITAFGRGNIKADKTFTKRYTQASVIDFTGNATIDNSTLVFCPLGTTAAPFYNAGDLIICLDSPYYKPTIISLASDIPDEFAAINKNIYVEGNNHSIANVGIVKCSGTLSNVVLTAGQIQNSNFVLRNVSGGVSYSLCSLDVIAGASPVSNTSVVSYPTSQNALRILQVTSGSDTYTFSGARPLFLLFCVLNGSTTTYSETEIIPFGAFGGASLESASYTASLNSAQTVLTLTKTSQDANVRVRAYAIY